MLSAYTMTFDGKLLQRGFWIYVCKVADCEKTCYYVGRTGDSSSPNAASPFNRIGNHLDLRDKAKGNAMTKRLTEAGMNPENCQFKMFALGPIFAEQATMPEHTPYRDRTAALEFEVAEHLRSCGHRVLGEHHRSGKIDEDLLQDIKSQISVFLSSSNP